MNTNILNKCIEELKKDEPDLSYLRGMLETLMELQGSSARTITTTIQSNDKRFAGVSFVAEPVTDEAQILDAQAKAAIENVKKLAEKNLE